MVGRGSRLGKQQIRYHLGCNRDSRLVLSILARYPKTESTAVIRSARRAVPRHHE